MSNLQRLVFLAVLLPATGTGCAHFSAIEHDVQGCVTQVGPQFIKDIEANAGKTVETILMCEAESSVPQTDVPMCVEQGLEGLAMSLGPDGERFVMCVENTIANDPNVKAAPRVRARARLMQARAGGRK